MDHNDINETMNTDVDDNLDTFVFPDELSDNESIGYNSNISDNESDDELSIDNSPSKITIISHLENNLLYLNEKKTRPYITKFEKVKIIGTRAAQIENGNSPLVIVPNNITSSLEIASLEYSNKKIPLLIRRYLSNGSYEDWRISDFVNV